MPDSDSPNRLTRELVLFGAVKTTWSFSAFTVLVYYAITNLSVGPLHSPPRTGSTRPGSARRASWRTAGNGEHPRLGVG